MSKYFRSQYYLSDALADMRQAFRVNEDIALGGLVIMSVISFAAISIFANLLFYFVMAASILAVLSRIDIAFLAIVAVAVITVLSVWVGAFLQNILMYALYEGSTRKQIKSLRRTIRSSLRYTAQTALAQASLLFAAGLPAVLMNAVLLGVIKLFNIQLAGALPYMIVVESIAAVWAIWVLLNYSLVPQVALFGSHNAWREVAEQAKKLVSNKGRVFTASCYITCVLGLGVAYLVAWGVHRLSGTGTTLVFALLGLVPITLTNASFTMLYRKRRLARS